MKKEAIAYLHDAVDAYLKAGKTSQSSRIQAINKLIDDVNKI
jgi:hypothetical protein